MIEEISHERFERKGNDLYIDVVVTISDLVLGTIVEIPTLSGKNIDVKVPPGHSPYVKLGVKGEGLTEENHLYVVPKLELPTSLDKRQKKLFKELREIENVIVV